MIKRTIYKYRNRFVLPLTSHPMSDKKFTVCRVLERLFAEEDGNFYVAHTLIAPTCELKRTRKTLYV